ncbi:YaeQ family protein [Pseudomaricurvus sp. HS19]|uniref:YaeQ family protein n=1 Tax=Pseudomaricurvus sp. HS19 TaxID=2692626 RepID=UPI00136899A3|nr:YaeQ family protein [Pseudomaricurvus sp. HS19]MYM62610.1 hypothetical protein [Pseudomaricurvus sp. HS19]
MALKATIYKVRLHIADLSRHYYQQHSLTVALHPSETTTRLTARLIAFACNASETLDFTRGLSTSDEPDIWQKEPDGSIALWIELGQPDVRRLRQASGKARQVLVYCYDNQRAQQWLQSLNAERQRLPNVRAVQLPTDELEALAAHLQRGSEWHLTLEENTVNIAGEDFATELQLQPLLN